MDRNEAASVIRKYLTCTDITHSCNGKCKACRYHTNDDEKELALRLAIAALDDKDINVPTKWIPVSEKLPEEKINPNTQDFEEVLCSTTFGDVRAYKFGTPLGWKEPHFWYGPGKMDEYVLAWMPLPELYKEK